MNNIEVLYAVNRNGEELFREFAPVGLTNKNVKDICNYILEDAEHQTGEIVDLPADVYDRINDKVIADAWKKAKLHIGEMYDDDIVTLQYWLPADLLNLLPDEVLDVLPDELFEEYTQDEEGEE